MTSRKSSGSMPVESAVEPTRSANITVTWRRSASSRGLESDPGASWGVVEAAPASLAIAWSNLRRSPRGTMPSSSLRSLSVRSRRIEKSIRCSAKRSAYSDRPSEASHSLTDGIALRVPLRECLGAAGPAPQRIARGQETAAVRDFDLAYVRFGSGADITRSPSHVRFTPKSGQIADAWGRPLCANGDLTRRSKSTGRGRLCDCAHLLDCCGELRPVLHLHARHKPVLAILGLEN